MLLVDLHVHTPASSCYQCKGDLTLEGHYLNVLRVYKEKNIKLIAVTDHNTLKGYKKLMSIKNELENKVELLKGSNNIDDNELKKYEEDLALFDEVNIIPGVEFTAYPHIHILLLFNKDSDLSRVDNFLNNCGYDTDYKQGRDLDNTRELDVRGILKEGREIGAITIAAHIDRETGILTYLQDEKIEDRSIFNCDDLMGVHVLKAETVSYLENEILNSNLRKQKLTFIKASDFHNEINDMEKRATLMELDSLNYEGLKNAFKNNNEKIKLNWN